MRIFGSHSLLQRCSMQTPAWAALFVLLLGAAPAADVRGADLDRNWQDDTAFWNSLSLGILEMRDASRRARPAMPAAKARRPAPVSTAPVSTVKNLDLLVVHRTEKLARSGGVPRRVTVAKAMLNIDGERRVLEQGQSSPEGVTLISAGSDHAVVEINGRRETLRLSVGAVFPAAADAEGAQEGGGDAVSLWEGPGGFFYADGAIDDYPVQFLLDTGANTIVISTGLARRIGIDYEGKQQQMAKTVGGKLSMVLVNLERVSVGNITLHDVAAGIFEGSENENVLLGMSFLGKVDMMRAGNRMELRPR